MRLSPVNAKTETGDLISNSVVKADTVSFGGLGFSGMKTLFRASAFTTFRKLSVYIVIM